MIRKIFFLLIIFLLLSGCKPHSINPITSSPDLLIDDRFNGTWIFLDKSGCFQIKKLKNGIIEINAKSDNHTDYIIATAYGSTIEGNNYLSIKVHNKPDIKNGYLIAKYRFIDSETLKFSYINSSELKRLILSNKLKGVIIKGILASPIITDSSTNIKHTIAKYSHQLFKGDMILHKGNCLPLVPTSHEDALPPIRTP